MSQFYTKDQVDSLGTYMGTQLGTEIENVRVKDVNSGVALKFWTGTQAELDAITTKDDNTVYLVI